MYVDHLLLESKESSFSVLKNSQLSSFHSFIFQMLKTYVNSLFILSPSHSTLHVSESPFCISVSFSFCCILVTCSDQLFQFLMLFSVVPNLSVYPVSSQWHDYTFSLQICLFFQTLTYCFFVVSQS